MSDAFSHPNFGHQIRIEQKDREVSIIFVADTIEKADSFCERLIAQLQEQGSANLTLMGRPAGITKT